MKRIIAFFLLLCLLALSSCASGKPFEVIENGELSFELYGSQSKITTIKVKKEKKTVCTLSCQGKEIAFEDLDFDGYDDLKLKDVTKKGHYQCFIYQDSVGTYTRNVDLNELLDPVWDADKQIISSRVYSRVKTTFDETLGEPAYKETRGVAIHEWIGGKVIKTYETGIEYFSDSGLFCVYVCTLRDNECVRESSADKWFYNHKQLTDAGYSWELDE